MTKSSDLFVVCGRSAYYSYMVIKSPQSYYFFLKYTTFACVFPFFLWELGSICQQIVTLCSLVTLAMPYTKRLPNQVVRQSLLVCNQFGMVFLAGGDACAPGWECGEVIAALRLVRCRSYPRGWWAIVHRGWPSQPLPLLALGWGLHRHLLLHDR